MRLPILNYPDGRLRIKARAVKKVNHRIQMLVDDMFETMYAEYGIGLAATQVNEHQQVVVMDVPSHADYEALKSERLYNGDNRSAVKLPRQNNPICLINPQVISRSGQTESEEGCLSVPEFQATVRRAEKITVCALDKSGKPFELVAEGLLAICIQHEIDHLRGKLFVDYLSKLKQERLKKKLEKLEV